MIKNSFNDNISFDADRITKDTKVCLFCFSYAGGSTSKFNRWSTVISKDITVLPITLPAHERRIEEKPITRLMPIVKSLTFEMRKYTNFEYAFYGECFGGLLAYEVAMEMMNSYNKKAFHLFVSGMKAPHTIHTENPIYILEDELFIENLKRNNAIPKEVLSNKELLDITLKGLKADFQIYETYQYKQSKSIEYPISILVGDEDEEFNMSDAIRWNEISSSSVDIISYLGNHLSMVDENKITAIIEEKCKLK